MADHKSIKQEGGSGPRGFGGGRGGFDGGRGRGGRGGFDSSRGRGGFSANRGRGGGPMRSNGPNDGARKSFNNGNPEEGAEQKRTFKPIEKEDDALIASLKKLWEKVKPSKVDKNKRKEYIDEMMKLIGDKLKSMAVKKVGGRILQTMFKFATREQIFKMLLGLKGTFLKMATDHYAVHTLIAILRHGGKKGCKEIAEELKGHYASIVSNKEGAFLTDFIYTNILEDQPQEQFKLVQEFYGREFALFNEQDADLSTLEQLVEKYPLKKSNIADKLSSLTEKMTEKGLTTFIFAHRIFADLFVVATEGTKKFVASSMAETAPAFMHTTEGSQAAINVLNYTDAKDRKAFVKGLKQHVSKAFVDDCAYAVMSRLLRVTDDTKLIEKSILSEVLENLDEVLDSEWGRRALLSILAEAEPEKHFPAGKHTDLVFAPIDAFCKKPWAQKRTEYLAIVSQPLVAYCLKRAGDMVRSPALAPFLFEVLKSATSDKSALVSEICSCLQFEDASTPPTQEDNLLLVEGVASSFASAVQADVAVEGHPFSTSLFSVLSPNLSFWSANGGADVVAALKAIPEFTSQIEAASSASSSSDDSKKRKKDKKSKAEPKEEAPAAPSQPEVAAEEDGKKKKAKKSKVEAKEPEAPVAAPVAEADGKKKKAKKTKKESE